MVGFALKLPLLAVAWLVFGIGHLLCLGAARVMRWLLPQ